MLQTKGFFKKKITLFLLLTVQSLFAIDFSFPFIENKGQIPKSIQAKVDLPGGALFVENGLFTYHFFENFTFCGVNLYHFFIIF